MTIFLSRIAFGLALVGGMLAAGLGASPTSAESCDPSYPDACIPPYPPDLDCGQIGPRRFTAHPPDPHVLDGNFDGVGCERR